MKKLNNLILIACLSIGLLATSSNTNAAIVISNGNGNWSNLTTWYVTLTGTINATTTSNIVTGNSTTFTTQLTVGTTITNILGTIVGTVASIQSNTQLTLTSNAAINMTSASTVRFRKLPTSTDDVRIINHTITLDAAGVCNTLQISGTSTTAANLNFNTGITLNVTGATTMSTPPGNAFYTLNINNGSFTTGSMVLGGSTANRMNIVNVGSAGSFDCLGNITFSGSGTNTGTRFTFSDFFGGSMTFRGTLANFQLTQTGLSTIKYLGAGAQTVRALTYGTLVLSGGTKTFQTSTTVSSVIEFIGIVALSGTYTPGTSMLYRFTNVNGTVTDAMWPASLFTSGGVEINTTGTTTLNNAKTIPGNGINVIAGNLSTNNFAITIGGNLTVGTSANVIGGSSNFIFNGGGNQLIGKFTTTGSVTISKTAGWAAFNGTVSAGPLIVSTIAPGEMSFGISNTLTFTSLTINSGSVIFGGSDNNVTFTGSGTNAGTFIPQTCSITWSGISLTVPPMGYYNLTFIGSGTFSYSAGGSSDYNNFSMQSVGGTLTHTISNSTVINNNLSIGANTVFNTGTKTLTVSGSTTIAGTVNFNDAGASKALTHVYINAGGTLNNSVNGEVSIAGDFANFGTANLGTGNYTFSGNGFQFSGNINIANMIITGIYFNAGTLTLNTNLSGSGTLNNNAAGILNFNTSAAPSITTLNCNAVGNTVNYSLAGNQTLRNTTYHHLNLSNSGTKNLPTGSININGNLTLSGTVISQAVASTTIGGNLSLQNTSSFNTSTQNLTVNGDISNVAGSTLTWGSGVITLAGSTQNISNANGGSITINNLVMSNGEKTFNNNLVNGTSFTINAGAKCVLGGAVSLTLNGTISGTGTVKAKSCGGAANTMRIGGTSDGNTIHIENGFQHFTGLVVTKTSGIVNINGNIALSTALSLPTTGTAQVTFNGDLNLYGTLTISSAAAKINMGANSSISIGGCVLTGTTFTIPSDIFNGNPTVSGLFLNRTNGLSLGNQMISVSEIVQLSAGNLNTNNNLTLLSTATKTARVAPIPAGISVTGSVTAQRFIPGGNNKRKWRFLSSPVNISGSISLSQFQDDIFVTAPAEAAGGFDVNPFSTNASIRTYDETVAGSSGNGWTDPTNITNTIATGQGVEVFVRGSRNLANPYFNWTVPDDVNIDFNGDLNTGTVLRNLSYTNTGAGLNDGFNFVGNPYASPINFDTAGLTKVNIENKFWTYNPNTTLYGSYNAANGESINGMSKYISSGQAFFVRATAANASITFTENCKSINAGSNFFKGNEPIGKFPTFKIMLTNSYSETDECLFIQDNTATEAGSDETDMYKFFNDELNVYFIAEDNSRLAMNAKPIGVGSDTLKLAVWSFDTSSISVAKHQLNFTRTEEIKPSIHLYIRDTYLNTLKDIRQESFYEFEITNDAKSYGNNRFQIIISDKVLTAVESNKHTNIKIYPNPCRDALYLHVPNSTVAEEKIMYELYDLMGRKILEDELLVENGKASISTTSLDAVTYILKINNNGYVINEKIIKQF